MAACDTTLDLDALLTWPAEEAWQMNYTARVQEVPRQDICREKGPYLAFLSPKMSLPRARRLCIAMGSVIAIPSSPEETQNILDLAKVAESSCPGALNDPFLWLGASDEVQEGQ